MRKWKKRRNSFEKLEAPNGVVEITLVLLGQWQMVMQLLLDMIEK